MSPVAQPPAAVLVFPGSNGEHDLLGALGRCGFAASLHPASQPLPTGAQLVALPGGFSYGDAWRAGLLASRAPAVQGLARFVAGGGLLLGVCNGFQILVAAGLLPGALTFNQPAGFQHRWVEVEVSTAAARSPWFAALSPGERLRLPIAHAQGCYLHPEGEAWVQQRAPLLYRQNPNGSQGAAAAMLDGSGRILGLMPHPERACDRLLGSDDGGRLFLGAWRHLAQRSAA